jgi:hypothetical protein
LLEVLALGAPRSENIVAFPARHVGKILSLKPFTGPYFSFNEVEKNFLTKIKSNVYHPERKKQITITLGDL